MREWPEALRCHLVGECLRLSSRGPHPFAWFALPFGLALGVAGAAGILGGAVVPVIVGFLALAFSFAVLASTATSAWGTLEIERFGSDWLVTRSLGPWRSVLRFSARSIRSVELYSASPGAMPFPGSAGRSIRIYVDRRARPIDIGAGMQLDAATLESLEQLFGTP